MLSMAKLLLMKSNLRAIRLRLGMTQRELAEVFGQTAANISHYENGKQDLPPVCARALIEAAHHRAQSLTFDEIYAAEKVSPADTAPEEEAA